MKRKRINKARECEEEEKEEKKGRRKDYKTRKRGRGAQGQGIDEVKEKRRNKILRKCEDEEGQDYIVGKM